MAVTVSAEQKQKILTGIMLLFGTAVWLNFIFLPQWSRFGRLNGEVRSMRQQMTRLRNDLTQLPALEENRRQLEGQLHLPAVALPPEQQLPNLLDRITQAARLSDVRLAGLKPKADLGSLKAGSSGYIEMPLEIVALAGFHSIGHFLDRLESSDDLLRVQELEIRSGSSDLWNHPVTILLVAYLAPSS